MQIKKNLRAELLSKRRAIADGVRTTKSQALSQRLYEVLKTRPAARLFAFAAVHGEPDLLALSLRLESGRFLLPYTDFVQRHLSFYAWKFGDPLVINRYGIPEPPLDAGQPAQIGADDVIAVPAVALTMQGDRLGYGGGFYDRILKSTPALVIGVVFDDFILPTLPMEDHDARVQMIITDQRLINVTN